MLNISGAWAKFLIAYNCLYVHLKHFTYMNNEHKTLTRSALIKNRLIECSKNGELMMDDEIEILQYLVSRLNLQTISNYSREQGISPAGAAKRCSAKKVANITLKGQTFIIP